MLAMVLDCPDHTTTQVNPPNASFLSFSLIFFLSLYLQPTCYFSRPWAQNWLGLSPVLTSLQWGTFCLIRIPSGHLSPFEAQAWVHSLVFALQLNHPTLPSLSPTPIFQTHSVFSDVDKWCGLYSSTALTLQHTNLWLTWFCPNLTPVPAPNQKSPTCPGCCWAAELPRLRPWRPCLPAHMSIVSQGGTRWK
jgi:hypothetical protein